MVKLFRILANLAPAALLAAAIITAGIIVGIGIAQEVGPRIEEYTHTQFNHEAQELQTLTCLVWWQEATPEGYGKILSCERID
jgi:hypothetical protein